jgi:hypothetical protein
MNKLSILAFTLVVAVGCGKKKDEPSASDKTTEMGKDTKPANPETATKPGDADEGLPVTHGSWHDSDAQ